MCDHCCSEQHNQILISPSHAKHQHFGATWRVAHNAQARRQSHRCLLDQLLVVFGHVLGLRVEKRFARNAIQIKFFGLDVLVHKRRLLHNVDQQVFLAAHQGRTVHKKLEQRNRLCFSLPFGTKHRHRQRAVRIGVVREAIVDLRLDRVARVLGGRTHVNRAFVFQLDIQANVFRRASRFGHAFGRNQQVQMLRCTSKRN